MAVTDTNGSYELPRLRTLQILALVPMVLSFPVAVLSLGGDTTEPLFAPASLVFIVSSAIIGALSAVAVFRARISWKVWLHLDIVVVVLVMVALAVWIPGRSYLMPPW